MTSLDEGVANTSFFFSYIPDFKTRFFFAQPPKIPFPLPLRPICEKEKKKGFHLSFQSIYVSRNFPTFGIACLLSAGGG